MMMNKYFIAAAYDPRIWNWPIFEGRLLRKPESKRSSVVAEVGAQWQQSLGRSDPTKKKNLSHTVVFIHTG